VNWQQSVGKKEIESKTSGLHSPARRTISLGALGLGLSLSAPAWAQMKPNPDSVSLETARAELEAGRALVFDIREPNEHATGVAAGAKLLPMRQLSQRLGEIPRDGKQPVFLICNTQNRSQAVLKALREMGGYENVRFVEGGMSTWARRGWPMVAPR